MARNVIINKGDGVQFELAAQAPINPGMTLERPTEGEVAPHSGGLNQKLFAIDFPELGAGVNHTYNAGEQVKLLSPQPGAELELLLAAGTTVTPADALVSNGDGSLTAAATDVDGNVTADGGEIVGYPCASYTVGASAERHTVRVI